MCSYKEELLDVPLPPEPIITCWETWHEVAEYNKSKFSEVKAVINTISGDESASVRKAQAALSEDSLQGDLVYLCACKPSQTI